MAQIKKDTSLRKAILQAAITGQLISDIGGESDVLFSNEKKSKTKLDSEADLLLASRVSKRNSVVSDSERTTPSPRGYAPKTPNEFASFENQNSVSERSERPTLPETGKQLLDRIIEERNNKLLADWEEKQTDLFASNDAHSKNAKTVRSEQIRLSKKIKKPEPIVASEIDEDEIPFEIPENWCWCRLGDLVTILGDGLHGTPQYDISGEYYFVNGNNLNNGVIEIKPDTKKINEKEFEKYKKDLNETTIFVSINGTIGNIAFYNNEKIILGKSACYFNVAIEDLKKYFFYLFQTDFFLNYALDNATGTTIKNVGLGTMRNFLLPLPPLSVQNAIVETLEQVLPLVDAYENAVLQKEELKSALPDKIKKAILQEAITGQLTENWRKSATIKESGKQLLDRIIEERNAKALADWEEALKKNPKAKKPVPVVASEIDEEEIPFEVPESWCWCRLGDLASIARGGSPRPINDFLTNEPDGYNWIKISDTDKGGKFINSTKQKIKKEGLYKTRLIHKGDFLLTNSMSFGRPYISNIEGCIHDGWLVFSFINELINPDFIYHLLSSPFIYDSFSQSAAGGVVQNLNTDKVIDTLVPLPPLEEQEAIVRKVEELLPLCKNIK